MNRFPNPTLDRRRLLRNGGLVVSMGAVIAACGSNRAGSDDPGRLGVADPAPTLPDAKVDDVVLLRTAQSLEYTALDVYAAAAAAGGLSDAELALVGRFVDDHTRHAAELGALITDAGGEQFPCANPFLTERAVAPVIGALEGTDDLHRDLLNIAHAFEDLAGSAYQSLVTSFVDLSLRKEAMRIGGEENRHSTALAQAINPGSPFSPALFGQPVLNSEAGFPVPYTIPSTFGSLAGIELIVGPRDAEGVRFKAQLQTPAANSLIYEYMSC